MRRELLLGCGSNRQRKIVLESRSEWENLTTLDENSLANPDIHFDLGTLALGIKLPIESQLFDEIHAYDVLEHTGRQGDYEGFFLEFSEYHRILKPGGLFFAICPSYKSPWAWGDPGHRRVITSGTLAFLDQREYEKQVGKTSMSDYRHLWKWDFRAVHLQEDDNVFAFVLEALK